MSGVRASPRSFHHYGSSGTYLPVKEQKMASVTFEKAQRWYPGADEPAAAVTLRYALDDAVEFAETVRFDASHGRRTMEYYDGMTFSFTSAANPDWPPVASGGRYDALTAVLGQGAGGGQAPGQGRGIPAVGGIIRPGLVAALC